VDERDRLRIRIKDLTGWRFVKRPEIVTDTSDCMRIHRGHILRIGGSDFLIQGNLYETRFGIGDQPKYWVFGALEMLNGRHCILKTVFHEEFNVHIGVFKIRCYRSPEKEARVLDLVRGDRRFMQGYTRLDDRGNHVRIIDFIRGPSIFNYIHEMNKSHEQYFHEDLPGILWNLVDCMEAIQFLHDNDTCHGDIRNDHIIIDSETGEYRWIDFDLNQHVLDFDVWSMGNILNYAVGKGINSFHIVMRSDQYDDRVKASLTSDDGSAFYEYRIINLKKLFPYVPDRLNDILMHFARKPRGNYLNMVELISDFCEMLEADFPGRRPERPADLDLRGEASA
jgi:serine/threonine protein kinase